MGGDHPMKMVLLIFICLFGITTTAKGTFFMTKEEVLDFLKLTCNSAPQVQVCFQPGIQVNLDLESLIPGLNLELKSWIPGMNLNWAKKQ